MMDGESSIDEDVKLACIKWVKVETDLQEADEMN